MNSSLNWHMRPARAFGAAIVFCLAWTSAVQAQSTVPNPLQGLREFLGPAIRVQQRHSQRLLADRDIVGTGVGLTANREPAIKVFTKSEAIMRIPVNIEGLPVEVEVTGEFQTAARLDREVSPARTPTNPARLFPRPVPIGVSIGNEDECSTGTVGARVVDSSGNVFVLSNNHVLALENTAASNSDIVQPGLANVKCRFTAENVIGTLDSFVPIAFSTSASNRVDAAIAASNVLLLGNGTPKNGYGTPETNIVSAFVGQTVQKYGERSKITRGRVHAINATVLVEYDSGTARFVNQIIVRSPRPFIRAGDSGALVVTQPGLNPVGLLFAGVKGGRMAIANPIDLVLNAFGVSIDGQ
ncbi:MAG: hypothetical protein ACREQ7_11170 [Candidatus Binatia bacterium]